MPAIAIPQYFTRIYRSPSTLLNECQTLFKENQEQFNIMYPQIAKAATKEVVGQLEGDHLWITCGPEAEPETIDLVVACSENALGKLPIFIASPHSISKLSDVNFVRPLLREVVSALYANIPTRRVFSVFSLVPVARIFAQLWTEKTGIFCEPKPYYFATYSRCTAPTLKNRQFTIFGDVTYNMRLADDQDIDGVAELCYEFASESQPFVLTREQALKEAALLIAQRQVYVHTINRPGKEEEIASIVAVTRESAMISAITKVFTNPRWRGKRCAERLVRHVTNTLLKTHGKKSVVLYVAGDNVPARKVYHRVGFSGLGNSTDGVEDWIEYGFDLNQVDLGHW